MAQTPPLSREWRHRHNQPKPPRLRSACNQCNSSKVKCTGERRGCARCNTLRTECVYEESRVGKVQSSRSKLKKKDAQQNDKFDRTEINVSPGTIVAAQPASTQTTSSQTVTAPLSANDTVASQTTQIQHHTSQCDVPAVGQTTQNGQVLNTDNDWSMSDHWPCAPAWNYDLPLMDNNLLPMNDFDIEQDAVTNQIDDGEHNDDALVSGGSRATSPLESGEASVNVAEERVRGAFATELTCSEIIPSTSSRFSSSAHSSIRRVSASNREDDSCSSPRVTKRINQPTLPTPSSTSITSPRANDTRHETNLSQPDYDDRGVHREVDSQMYAKLDSKCVMSCTHILATLENYLFSDLRPLDLVLGAVRKASDELQQLVQCQQESRCDRCIILFTAIMFQIIGLLEISTAPLPETELGFHGGIFSGMQTSFVPALGFGAFSLTSEEQRSWRSQIVLREFRHVGEILSSITGLARLGPRGSTPVTAEMMEQRTGCLKNLERKLRSLAERQGANGF